MHYAESPSREYKKYPHPWSCAPVDAFPENVTPDGVVGMTARIEEWCSDFYGVRYLKKDLIDPKGPTEKDLSDKSLNPFGEKYHVYRGSNKGRSFGDTVGGSGIYGFRILMEVDQDQREHRKVPSVDFPVEFTVSQRSTTPLPKSDGKLLLTLDDITRGQVLVTLASYDGKPVTATRSLRENDIVEFSVGKHAYKLKLKTLTNRLLRNDYAVFQLWPTTAEAR